jgi:hypothetical protein
MTAVAATNEVLREVEGVTGKPVVIEADAGLRTHATAMIARGDVPLHQVRYRADLEPERAYLVTYQCGFILRQAQAGAAGQFDLVATPGGRREAEDLIRYHFAKKKKALPDHLVAGLCDQLYHGLGVQLRSAGPGLRLDAWVAERYPVLAEQQRASVVRQLNENAQTLRPEVKDMTPHRIFSASVGMNAAVAAFFARQWADPLVVEPYRAAGLMATGEALLRLFDQTRPDPTHDADLILGWAQALQVGSWFQVVPRSP